MIDKNVISSPNSTLRFLSPLLAGLALMVAGGSAQAQTATAIAGLYNTGLTAGGGLAAGGTQAADWTVNYASTNGGASNNGYLGAGYVISPSSISGSGYTQNTSTAQWITVPGAGLSASGNAQNTGGDYAPGNGNTGSNEGIYIYTLAFTITGTGSAGTVVNGTLSQIQITLTMAADDQYSVYVNPTGSGASIPGGTAAASQTSAWNNTTQFALQNYGSGSANNSIFKIGTNYLVVVVDNTNGINGASGSTTLNSTGLLVYQTGSALINGHPVPEVAAWLPLLGVIGCYGLVVLRRRQALLQPVHARARGLDENRHFGAQ